MTKLIAAILSLALSPLPATAGAVEACLRNGIDRSSGPRDVSTWTFPDGRVYSARQNQWCLIGIKEDSKCGDLLETASLEGSIPLAIPAAPGCPSFDISGAEPAPNTSPVPAPPRAAAQANSGAGTVDANSGYLMDKNGNPLRRVANPTGHLTVPDELRNDPLAQQAIADQNRYTAEHGMQSAYEPQRFDSSGRSQGQPGFDPSSPIGGPAKSVGSTVPRPAGSVAPAATVAPVTPVTVAPPTPDQGGAEAGNPAAPESSEAE